MDAGDAHHGLHKPLMLWVPQTCACAMLEGCSWHETVAYGAYICLEALSCQAGGFYGGCQDVSLCEPHGGVSLTTLSCC